MSITKTVPNKIQNFFSRREGRQFCKANGIKQSLLKKDPVTGMWNVVDDKPTTEPKGITKISIPKKPVKTAKTKKKSMTFAVREVQKDPKQFLSDTWYTFKDPESKARFSSDSSWSDSSWNRNIANRINSVGACLCISKCREGFNQPRFKYIAFKEKANHTCYPNLCLHESERKYFVEVEPSEKSNIPVSCQRNVKFVRISDQSYDSALSRLLPKHADLIRETQSRIGYFVVDSETNMLYNICKETNMLYNICKLTDAQLALFEEI